MLDAVGSAFDGAVHTVEHAATSAPGAVEHAATATAGAVEDTAKLGAHAVASGAKGLYQFAVGDDIDTLRDGKSSWWQKGLAVADIASNFVAPEFKGAEVAGKLALKGVEHVAEHAAVHAGETAAVHAGEHAAERGAVRSGEHAAEHGAAEHGAATAEQKLEAHLPPNQKIEAGGYHFETDAQGRVSRAQGQLRLEGAERPRNTTAQAAVGGKDRLPTDAGGHLIAHRFGGPSDFVNLVPQDAKLNNQRPWKSLENAWAKELKAGKDVSVDIRPVYEGKTLRPSEFEIDYTVNGKPFSTTIANKTGG